MVDRDAIKRRFESLLPTVDERMRRLIAPAESLAIDYGGISIVSRATGVSRRAIALRTLLQVQRSGDSGSPRLSGSIRCSKSLTNVASCSAVRLRPPPGLRTAPPEGTGGLSSSTMPRAIARLDTPVARETMEIPP